MSITEAGGRGDPESREKLRRAYEDLHPSSEWRGAVLTALRAVDDGSPARAGALLWLHETLTSLLPEEPRADSFEQRVLRCAAGAIEDELVADHVGSPQAA